MRAGLSAPICLTWEVTYACNLACVHCLSSSGRRRPEELDTAEAKDLLDQFAAMRIFYVNVGGGEPMYRADFFELLEHSVGVGVGVKFSTNGTLLGVAEARRIAALDYIDVQISLDGATEAVNDPVRGTGSYARARRAMDHLARAGVRFKINTVVTRHSFKELDALYDLAALYAAELRVTRLRPSGRGVEVWQELRLLPEQQAPMYRWLRTHPDVLTGDSFFHLSAYGEALPGMNMCGAGRIVCCVDPVGDVYACPFVLAPEFKAGNVRDAGGFVDVWQKSEFFRRLREPEAPGTACGACGAYAVCHSGCMAVKHGTGTPLDAPDPECVKGVPGGLNGARIPVAVR